MKKIIIYCFLLLCLLAGIAAYMVLGSGTNFNEASKTILVDESNTNKEGLIKLLKEKDIISNAFVFEQLGNQLKIWDRFKSGKYKINKGESPLDIARIFRNNKQAEVNLVINKIRTVNDLARLIGRNFSTDSATALSILTNPATLATINADSNSLIFNIIPNTYNFYWSTPVEKMLEKLAVESKKFWDNNDRTNKAANLGLTPYQVYTIASIVEEETNNDAEKGNIASVYINRMNKGMNLAADPTVKFALKDFAIKRVLHEHLNVQSPYNTYKVKGLPPGAICTPSKKTIDAVLAATRTDYLFFCADASFNGTHHFSSNYAEHEQYAKAYHRAQDQRKIK
ncbi:MAG: endolytic transglycosylase MltG [Bacteroidetes bacterium]|nr:endolytic transglycosylase MltG [Bacteroidota bacterium]